MQFQLKMQVQTTKDWIFQTQLSFLVALRAVKDYKKLCHLPWSNIFFQFEKEKMKRFYLL